MKELLSKAGGTVNATGCVPDCAFSDTASTAALGPEEAMEASVCDDNNTGRIIDEDDKSDKRVTKTMMMEADASAVQAQMKRTAEAPVVASGEEPNNITSRRQEGRNNFNKGHPDDANYFNCHQPHQCINAMSYTTTTNEEAALSSGSGDENTRSKVKACGADQQDVLSSQDDSASKNEEATEGEPSEQTWTDTVMSTSDKSSPTPAPQAASAAAKSPGPDHTYTAQQNSGAKKITSLHSTEGEPSKEGSSTGAAAVGDRYEQREPATIKEGVYGKAEADLKVTSMQDHSNTTSTGTLMEEFLSEISPLPRSGQHKQVPSSPGAFAVDNGMMIPANARDKVEVSEELQHHDTPPPPSSLSPAISLVSVPATLSPAPTSVPPQQDANPTTAAESRTPPTISSLLAAAPMEDTVTNTSTSFMDDSRQVHYHTDEENPFSMDGGNYESILLDDDLVKKDVDHPGADATTGGCTNGNYHFFLVLLGIATVALVILFALGLAGIFESTPLEEELSSVAPPPQQQLSKLETIRQRGYLKCSYRDLPGGMMYRDPPVDDPLQDHRIVTGFAAMACQAVAAAIWGEEDDNDGLNDRIEYLEGWGVQVDINSAGSTHTMKRDVRQENGRSYSAPYLYDGLHIMGDPFFVECLEDKDFKHMEECQDVRVCVGDRSSHMAFALTVLPQAILVPLESHMEILTGFASGSLCNVFMYENLGEKTIRELGYYGPFAVSRTIYAKEPLCLAMDDDDNDPQWVDFVSVVWQALLVAEQHGITQSSAYLFPQTDVFGDQYRNMFRNAVRAVGNYGEFYQRFLEESLPREPVNQLNNGSSGLLYSHPVGILDDLPEEERILGPRLQSVLDRGQLRCGIQLDRPGFATSTIAEMLAAAQNRTVSVQDVNGMDVDFCKAVAASLFQGDAEAVEFVSLADSQDGYQVLAKEEIDIFAGATWNLANDVKEPTTGLGFSFSQPYFYGYSDEQDNLCLATMQDDQDWSAYVYWIVTATIYAEERSIQQYSHNDMPLLPMYGATMLRIFRDAIFGVGNYGEIYSRNVEAIIPRSGRNLLNDGPNFGPQHYPMPGMLL